MTVVRTPELVLPLPPQVMPLVGVRSTLLLAAVEGLKEEGVYPRYVEAAPPETVTALASMVAGEWIHKDVALSHWAACDALNLSPSRVYEIGRRTYARVRTNILGAALRLATGTGVTPWTLMGNVDRLWARTFQGSAVSITRLGPKDARLDIYESPLFLSSYFRNAFRGHVSEVLELFCVRCVLTELRDGASATFRSYKVQWA